MIVSPGRRAGAYLVAGGLLLALTSLGGVAQATPTTKDWWYTRLDVAAANRVSTGAGVTVAVVDTGVQASLPDLRGRVLAGKSYYGTGDGRVDSPNKKATYFGHGTAMAGLIAGNGGGAGMRGIAPSATILPVAVGATDEATDDALVKGIVWAADHGADIINLSLGEPRGCPAGMQQAVDHALRKDVIVVAGTGNIGGAAVSSPANCIGAIAVGGLAYSSQFRVWSGSATGPELDFVAPADHTRSLLLDNTLSNPDSGGTSNSTAFVSGTFALLRSKFPNESARQIVTRALWNVKNGLGGKVFAKRIDDKLGYGEILPRFALTDAPPPGASNPIYDEIERHLAATSSSAAAPSPPSSAATGPRTADAARDDSGGSSTGAIAVVVGSVVLVVILVAVVVRSRRRPSTPSGRRLPTGPPGNP